MKSIGNLRIGTRLGIGFAILTIFLCGIGLFGAKQLSGTSELIRYSVEERYATVSLVEEIRRSVSQQIVLLHFAVLSAKEPSEAQKYIQAYDDGLRKNTERFQKLKTLMVTPKDEESYARLTAARIEFGDYRKQVFDLITQNRDEEAREFLLKSLRPSEVKFLEEMRSMVDYQTALVNSGVKDAVRMADDSVWVTAELAGAAVVLALIISLIVTRSITGPLRHAVEIANTVAAGDLTSRIEIVSRDELGALLSALQAMNAKLVSVVSAVRDGSSSVAVGAKEIAAGNMDLSRRTEQQAASLEQAAASMEELSSVLQNNVGTAQNANLVAAKAFSVAERGRTVTSDVMKTMELITASSRRIGEITGVINSIAFQTNILALNAAVEAARAGEQGRGFAVVASEVRALAQRSSSAAKEIEVLIQDCVSNIESGSAKVSEAGRTIADVTTHVQQVTTLIGEISLAAEEQAVGVSQVETAVGQLDKVTQQNAALVEESAAAAESLDEQAEKLVEMVRVFKVPEGAATESLKVRRKRPALPYLS